MSDSQPPELWAVLTSPTSRDAVAGAAGGLVRWITLRETLRVGGLSIITGAISAIYLGPLVAPIMEPVIGRIAPDGDANGFAAFVVGLGGVALTGFLIDIIRARRVAAQEARVEASGRSSRAAEEARQNAIGRDGEG